MSTYTMEQFAEATRAFKVNDLSVEVTKIDGVFWATVDTDGEMHAAHSSDAVDAFIALAHSIWELYRPARGARSQWTGHVADCPVYNTLDESECDCIGERHGVSA